MQSLWDSFREELIATSLVLVVAIAGSFYITHLITQRREPAQTELAETVQEQVNEMVSVLGEQNESEASEPAEPESTPTTGASPTPDPMINEVFYGVGGLYDYESYRLEINSPRIVFDSRQGSTRRLVIDFVLYNKNVKGGMVNTITATIIKDGIVIVPKAALSMSETKVIMPGEKLTFSGKLSLIESTDVREIQFRPPGQEESLHLLLP